MLSLRTAWGGIFASTVKYSWYFDSYMVIFKTEFPHWRLTFHAENFACFQVKSWLCLAPKIFGSLSTFLHQSALHNLCNVKQWTIDCLDLVFVANVCANCRNLNKLHVLEGCFTALKKRTRWCQKTWIFKGSSRLLIEQDLKCRCAKDVCCKMP